MAKRKPKLKHLTRDEIQNLVLTEVTKSEEYSQVKIGRRTESWDRYYGDKLGNEIEGRSQFITNDTMDTIEWMMPYFMRTFFGGDSKIELKIKGQPSWVGRGLMKKIHEDLTDSTPTLYAIGYQWIKDALITDTAFVKSSWNLDTEDIVVDFDSPLTAQQFGQLMQDPEVQILQAQEVGANPFTPSTYNSVSIKTKKVHEDSCFVENVPHWEFLTVKQSRDINDHHPKGHRTEVTMDFLKRINRAYSTGKKQFFVNLKDVKDSTPQTTVYGSIASDGNDYVGRDKDSQTDLMETQVGAKQPIEFIEWYTQLDVNGDDYLENIICWFANGILIRWEIDKDKLIPFSSLKPIIDCYRFYGISYADLIVPLQNLHTMLIRHILDNFAFTNLGRYRVDPDAQLDLRSFLEAVPGGVVFGKKDAIEFMGSHPFQGSSLSILDYVKGLRDDRTGVSRFTQQADPAAAHGTASGIMQIQSAAMQRLDHIARIFAETGMSDFYRKQARLFQLNLKRPFTVNVDGTERTITPEIIQGKIVAHVNMGITASVGVQEAQKIEQMTTFLVSLNQQFPGLLGPEKIHNIATRYIANLGWKDTGDFVTEMQQYIQSFVQQQQMNQQMQQQMMEFQKQLEMMDRQLADRKIKSKAQTEMTRIQTEDIADQRKFQTNLDRVQQQEQRSILNSVMDRYQADLTSNTEIMKEIIRQKGVQATARIKQNQGQGQG